MQFKQLMWQAFLPLLLASSATAEKDVTCTTNEVNLVQNPSFESGSLSGWELVGDNMHLATGHKAAHGDCHLERSSKSNAPLSGVYQEVSGLVKGSTYTVSAQWRIQKPVADGKAACDLAFYMVGGRSTSYIGGYENLRATPENTAWKTVSAEFTAKSTSGTLYIYLFCPVVRRHQAKADLDNIKLLSGETTTTCVTAATSPTSTPAVSVPTLPSIDSSSGNPVIPSQIASVQPSSAPITDSGSITSSHPASSISHSSIPTSSSLIRVTISSRPHPSSRPTPRPIASSSVPIVSPSVSIPLETAPTTDTPTGPSDIPTSLPSSVPATGSGNGSGNGGSGNGGSGNGGSGNGGSGNGGSGNGGSGNGGSGNGGSGNGGSGNGGSGNGGSGNGGSGNGGSGSVRVTTSAPTAPQLTTSTVFTTRTSTITACAATVTNCPARSTYVTTETIIVSTTICPVEASTTTNPGGAIITGSPAAPGNAGGHHYTTETILSTRTITVTACPSTVTNCPARDKTTSVATETVVAGTTVYEVTPTATGVSAGQKPAPGQDSNGNAPGPKVTEIATANPNIPPVYVTSTRVVTVLACPVKKDTLA